MEQIDHGASSTVTFNGVEVNSEVCLSLSRQPFWLYYYAEETECAFVLEMGDNSPFFLLGCLVTIIVLAAVGVGILHFRSGAWYAMVALVVLLTAALSREVFLLFICRAPTASSDVQGRANENVQLFRFREVGASSVVFALGLYSIMTNSMPWFSIVPENSYFAPSWDRAAFDRVKCCSVDAMFLYVLLLPLAIRKPRFFVTAAVAVLLMFIHAGLVVYFSHGGVLPVVARIAMMVVVGVGILWNVRTSELTDRNLFDHFETTKHLIRSTNVERADLERFVDSLLPPLIRRRLFASNYGVVDQSTESVVLFLKVQGIAEYCHKQLPHQAAVKLGALHAKVTTYAQRRNLLCIACSGDTCLVAGHGLARPPQQVMCDSLRFVCDVQAVRTDIVFRVAVTCGTLFGCVVGHMQRRYTVVGEALKVAEEMLRNNTSLVPTASQFLLSSQALRFVADRDALTLTKVNAGVELERQFIEVFSTTVLRVPEWNGDDTFHDANPSVSDTGNVYRVLGLGGDELHSQVDEECLSRVSLDTIPMLCGCVTEFRCCSGGGLSKAQAAVHEAKIHRQLFDIGRLLAGYTHSDACGCLCLHRQRHF